MQDDNWGICKDGGWLCCTCLETEKNLISVAEKDGDDQWNVIGHQTPEHGTICDHCGKVARNNHRRIPITNLE